MKTKDMIFPYKLFPVKEGFDLRVVWDIEEGRMGGCLDQSGCYGWINLHPYTFVSVVQEMYGPDRALDFLKIFLHDNIDNLAEKHFRPLLEKIERRSYGAITRKFNQLSKKYYEHQNAGFYSSILER